MLSITDLKIGTRFLIDGNVFQVLFNEHSKQARGGAVVRTKLKNLMTGAVIDKTFRGSEKFDEAKIDREESQFLYKEGKDFYFMNNESYDQFSLGKDVLGSSANFIKEGDSIVVHFHNKKPLGVSLPPKVKLKVTIAEKGLKGNTVSGSTKPITLETGYVLQAPLFIKEGDIVLINTESGEYVERV